MVKRECAYCGAEFAVEAWRLKDPRRGRFCSRACANIVHRPLVSAAKAGVAPANKGEQHTITCAECGVAFTVPTWRLRNGAKCCSRTCAHKLKTRRTGADHPLYTSVALPCQNCGKACRVKPAKLGEFRFCSRQCHGAHTAANFRGPSSIETALLSAFHARGMTPTAQFCIGPWVADFAFIPERLVVEADGSYWHAIPARVAKDRQKDGFLAAAGWAVMRISEADIRASADDCAVMVAQRLELIRESARLASPR